MTLFRWNYDLKDYELYEIPNDWECPLYCEDMKRVINCVSCGEKIKYGDSYTSKEIHNRIGLGYAVCGECHEKEWLRWKKKNSDI